MEGSYHTFISDLYLNEHLKKTKHLQILKTCTLTNILQ